MSLPGTDVTSFLPSQSLYFRFLPSCLLLFAIIFISEEACWGPERRVGVAATLLLLYTAVLGLG